MSQLSNEHVNSGNRNAVLASTLADCMLKGISKKKTLGDRAFAVAAPRLWNCLPEELRSKSDIEVFKRHLKAHFFTKVFSTPESD